MSISAMKQALEALDSDDPSIQLRAAVALRQAIAEAEKQEPVAWMSLSGQLYRTRWGAIENGEQMVTPLYAAPVHASDISQECVDETAKRGHEDWYGQHQWQCGYERGWDAAWEKASDTIAELERESMMLRARNERLEKEAADREKNT